MCQIFAVSYFDRQNLVPVQHKYHEEPVDGDGDEDEGDSVKGLRAS